MKKWIQIHVLGKKYVVVKGSGEMNHIHYYTCEWVDNIKNPKYFTK